uniref:Uncharacterized protein n=1 Tax=uncultured Desulfobacterium sp. TaxID=201089 RepID=E1YH68_9BACT|nr:unknown protein [uncultured Desulfobacterium sp.]
MKNVRLKSPPMTAINIRDKPSAKTVTWMPWRLPRHVIHGPFIALKKQHRIVDPMSRLIFIKIKLPKVSDIFSGFKFFFLTKSFSKGPLLPDK